MNAALFASLVAAIDEWAEANCEENGWNDQWHYEDETTDMAKAAALVFDASVKGQKFAKDQEE